MISVAERSFIAQGVTLGCRADGRGCQDHRPLQLEVGVVPQANGSARAFLGASEVMIAVKVRAAVPAFRSF